MSIASASQALEAEAYRSSRERPSRARFTILQFGMGQNESQPRRALQVVRSFGLIALFLAAALFGIASGVMFAFVGDLPQISALDDYSPSTTTRVLGRDGAVVGEFASERRQIVTYDQIPSGPAQRDPVRRGRQFLHPQRPPDLSGSSSRWRQATSCTGAVRRRQHADAAAGAQAVPHRRQDAWNGRSKKRCSPSRSRSGTRSRKSSRCTATRCTWGHLTYGVEAASQLYFAQARVRTESRRSGAHRRASSRATSGRARTSTCRRPCARRNYTLDRMAAEGYITAADAEAAKKRPIVTRGQPSRRDRSRRTFWSRSASSSRNATAPRRCTRTG